MPSLLPLPLKKFQKYPEFFQNLPYAKAGHAAGQMLI
jgi:hypothetical protein